MIYLTNTPDTFEHGPFDARDLPNVLDRVETPVTLDVDGIFYAVRSVDRGWNDTFQLFLDGDNDNPVTVDGRTIVTLEGPVRVLDAPDGVKFYGTRDGELLCAEHGAPFDLGLDDGAVWPVFDADMFEWSAVEYCSDGPGHGHSFCTCCGSGIDPDDMSAVLSRCWNCHTESVYVDGHGFSWTSGWGDMLDAHNVEVRADRVTAPCPPADLNGSTRITAVEDVSGTDPRRVRFYVAWLDVDPSAGTLLVLSDGSTSDTAWNHAYDTAVAHFEVDDVDPADLDCTDEPDCPGCARLYGSAEDIRADQHAALQLVEVDRDRVTVTSKR